MGNAIEDDAGELRLQVGRAGLVVLDRLVGVKRGDLLLQLQSPVGQEVAVFAHLDRLIANRCHRRVREGDIFGVEDARDQAQHDGRGKDGHHRQPFRGGGRALGPAEHAPVPQRDHEVAPADGPGPRSSLRPSSVALGTAPLRVRARCHAALSASRYACRRRRTTYGNRAR